MNVFYFLFYILQTIYAYESDTISIKVIDFSTPSPTGWNAQYKTKVTFPYENQWAKILMVQKLKCDSLTAGDQYPCGEWDYIWNTFIYIPNGDSIIQYNISSFVTPYGKRLEMGGEKGWEWIYDISEYSPILKGTIDLEVGNNQELLDLEFKFIKGTPPQNIISIENIYPYGEYKYEHLANDSVLNQVSINLNKNAKAYKIKSIISGHGHSGPYNCCEWDSKTHTWYINGYELFRWNVWTDCGNNPLYPQGGTWPFNRAGWCPGTIVDEYEFELTPFVIPGDTIILNYGIENYYNNGEKDGTFRMNHQLITLGPPNFKYDAELIDIISPSNQDRYSRINPICNNPQIIIKNSGEFNLKSLNIEFGFKDYKKTYFSWYGNLLFAEKDTLTLPMLNWNNFINNHEFIVKIYQPNRKEDENKQNNIMRSYAKSPQIMPSNFILKIHTNNMNRAQENSFTISDNNGEIYYYENNFSDDQDYSYNIQLDSGCYQFSFIDDMEDGISEHWWNRNSNPDNVGSNGSIKILSLKGDVIYKFKSDFGQSLNLNFIVK